MKALQQSCEFELEKILSVDQTVVGLSRVCDDGFTNGKQELGH